MQNKIVLLGHGAGVKFVIDALLKSPQLQYEVAAVVTHPYSGHLSDLTMAEKRKDLYGKYAYNVFNVPSDYGIPILEAEDVNEDTAIAWITAFQPRYVISIGCRNIIKKKFLAQYAKRVLNIHTTPLPKYRGAANDTWMILNGEWGTEQYGCMHFIDEGIDTGDIVAKVYYTVPDYCYPIDLYKVRINTFGELIIKGIQNLDNPDFIAEKQKIDESTTFPRLSTPRDGCIDFQRFDGHQLVRFIYSFGYPFEGAHCFLDDKKLNILAAEFYNENIFHAFAIGLIFGKNEFNEYKVAVKDGYLLIKKVEIDGEVIEQKKVLKLGKYLR